MYHIAAVYHEAYHLRENHYPAPADLRAIEAFGEELIAAIDRHPDADARNLMDLMFSVGNVGLTVEVDDEVAGQFLVACMNLHGPEAIVTARPFKDMLSVGQQWFPEHDLVPTSDSE